MAAAPQGLSENTDTATLHMPAVLFFLGFGYVANRIVVMERYAVGILRTVGSVGGGRCDTGHRRGLGGTQRHTVDSWRGTAHYLSLIHISISFKDTCINALYGRIEDEVLKHEDKEVIDNRILKLEGDIKLLFEAYDELEEDKSSNQEIE